MAGGIVSPASLLDLISDIVETPLNSGVFKKDCADLTRRVCLLTHLVEEIRDSTPIDSAASSSSENDWWSDLVVGLQAAKRLLSTARLQARDSSDGAAKRISFRFQCVTWKLEKALSNLPYDLYDISDEVIEQVELARSQLRRAMQRYGSLNSEVQIYKSPWVSKKLQCIAIVLTLKAKISAGYDPTLHFGSKALKKNNQASGGAKKLVKDPKSRLSKDPADKRKASRPIRKGRPTKMSPLDEARARADKLRNFKADLQKMKKEKEFPSMFGFSVSHTTRAPRCMEKNSVHYHFTDKTVMEKKIKDEKFLEFASVHGNLYGSSIESVEVVTDSGKVIEISSLYQF